METAVGDSFKEETVKFRGSVDYEDFSILVPLPCVSPFIEFSGLLGASETTVRGKDIEICFSLL